MKRLSLLRRIASNEIAIAAHAIWLDKSIADRIAVDTVQSINQTYCRKIAFFGGKSSKCLVGGFFYLLGYRHNAIKKQSEIADQLHSSDVSIRVAYRKWIETFPDLFLDVITKFTANIALQPYVLIDLKQSLHQSKNPVFAV